MNGLLLAWVYLYELGSELTEVVGKGCLLALVLT